MSVASSVCRRFAARRCEQPAAALRESDREADGRPRRGRLRDQRARPIPQLNVQMEVPAEHLAAAAAARLLEREARTREGREDTGPGGSSSRRHGLALPDQRGDATHCSDVTPSVPAPQASSPYRRARCDRLAEGELSVAAVAGRNWKHPASSRLIARAQSRLPTPRDGPAGCEAPQMGCSRAVSGTTAAAAAVAC
eukprot:364183-Chlamydomonas_euryale.AAC.20